MGNYGQFMIYLAMFRLVSVDALARLNCSLAMFGLQKHGKTPDYDQL